jgi:hypothetical protein
LITSETYRRASENRNGMTARLSCDFNFLTDATGNANE